MTVALVVATEEIRTGTTDPHTWSHAGGTPKGIVLAAVHGVAAAQLVTGAVTYGAVAMQQIEYGFDQAVEPGAVTMWFLGSGIPTGTQTVSADLSSGSTTDIAFFLWELSGGGDTCVIDFEHIIDDAANPTALMRASGANKISLCAMYGGGSAPTGTLATGNTASQDHDLGNFYAQACHETTVDALDHTIGWSTLGTDDLAFVALAVAEVADAPGHVLRTTANAIVSTPDNAALDIAGDIDIRVCILPHSTWNFGTSRDLVAKRSSAAATQKSYQFGLFRTGGVNHLTLLWKEAGGTERTAQTSTSVSALFGGVKWLRVTLDVDQGGQWEVKFYQSDESILTDPASVSWTQHGTTVTGATGVTSIFNSTSPVELGSYAGGTTFVYHGQIYYAEIRDGIAGTIVANPDFRYTTQQDSSTQLTDDQGRVWTVNSPAVWVSPLTPPVPSTYPLPSEWVVKRRIASHLAM